MATIDKIAAALGLECASPGAEPTRAATSVYCCDLLSFAMGRAPQGCVWVTVMGNVNVVAVASLADVGCVVVADGAALDDQAAQKAKEQGIAIFKSNLPVFETAKAIDEMITDS